MKAKDIPDMTLREMLIDQGNLARDSDGEE
jgi:hypothetical protein